MMKMIIRSYIVHLAIRINQQWSLSQQKHPKGVTISNLQRLIHMVRLCHTRPFGTRIPIARPATSSPGSCPRSWMRSAKHAARPPRVRSSSFTLLASTVKSACQYANSIGCMASIPRQTSRAQSQSQNQNL